MVENGREGLAPPLQPRLGGTAPNDERHSSRHQTLIECRHQEPRAVPVTHVHKQVVLREAANDLLGVRPPMDDAGPALEVLSDILTKGGLGTGQVRLGVEDVKGRLRVEFCDWLRDRGQGDKLSNYRGEGEITANWWNVL